MSHLTYIKRKFDDYEGAIYPLLYFLFAGTLILRYF